MTGSRLRRDRATYRSKRHLIGRVVNAAGCIVVVTDGNASQEAPTQLPRLNNLEAWLEVKQEFLRLGISAQRFYACRARGRDRRETDEEVTAAFDSWRARQSRS
jgi:hypothetical protein